MLTATRCAPTSARDEPRLLRRTMDAAVLNVIVNHPQVRPHLGGAGPLDVTPIVSDPRNVALVGDHGGFILHRLAPGLYESHTQFVGAGRGRRAIAAAAEGLRYLFTATDCVEVVTRVPAANRAAAWLARAAGFELMFSRAAAWPQADGTWSAVDYLSLTFDRWRGRDPEIARHGRWFHDRIEAAKAEAGARAPAHADDDAHDRAVGASVLMLRAGNPARAVAAYNRWAALAGYAPIGLLSANPAVIDVRDAVVEVRGDEMEVLLCR